MHKVGQDLESTVLISTLYIHGRFEGFDDSDHKSMIYVMNQN